MLGDSLPDRKTTFKELWRRIEAWSHKAETNIQLCLTVKIDQLRQKKF